MIHDPPTAQDGIPSWAVVSPTRRAHILRVADLMTQWGAKLGLSEAELARWREAALLHDALRDASVATLNQWDPDSHQDAELRHGPAAAAAAAALGTCQDSEILLAVRWHTLGWSGWLALGRALYAADFLEPGRSFLLAERATLAQRFPEDPDGVLRQVALLRHQHAVEAGWEIALQSREFLTSVLG